MMVELTSNVGDKWNQRGVENDGIDGDDDGGEL